MLKIFRNTSVFSKTSYYLEAKHTLILFLILLHLGSTAVWAEKLQSVDFIKVGFVAFDVGEYRQKKFGQVGKIYNQLQTFPDSISIRLIGHSHSKTNLASKKLASIRASTVRDHLVNFGIAPASIIIDYDVQNFVTNKRLLHGVTVLASTEMQSDSSVSRHGQLITSGIASTSKSTNPSVQASAIVTSSIEIEPDRDLCNLVSISSGSLRDNLEREISECGYIMGRWRFGTGDEVIDWHVPVAYSTVTDNGIIDLLQLIEHNYQIRAQVHELDDSIDFFPSIRDRGNRSQ